MFSAIILAAGASQRMGYPKALLRYRGQTFLGTIVVACRAVGIARAVVVLGPDEGKVLQEVDLQGTTVLRNPDPASGPLASLQLALARVLNHPVEAVLVWHVDRPHVSLTTIQALVERFGQGQPDIVLPVHGGRRGHPVLFGRRVFGELLNTPQQAGARAVVHADPARVAAVPVDDPAVVEDVDTPEAYRELLRRVDHVDAASPRPPESPLP
jgi:molybdenum cofactor cytidylyltransferase